MTVPLITDTYHYVADDFVVFGYFQVLKKFVVPVYFVWLFLIA